MGTLALGELELTLTRPDDLADRVLAETGLGMEEARSLLLSPSPALLASAILPLLSEGGPSRAELGEALAAADVAAVIAAVDPFYAEEEPHAGE
jgi:hypothetical protein